jgi:hypothetical protein
MLGRRALMTIALSSWRDWKYIVKEIEDLFSQFWNKPSWGSKYLLVVYLCVGYKDRIGEVSIYLDSCLSAKGQHDAVWTHTRRSFPRNPARNHREQPDLVHSSRLHPPIPGIGAIIQLLATNANTQAHTSLALQSRDGVENHINGPR